MYSLNSCISLKQKTWGHNAKSICLTAPETLQAWAMSLLFNDAIEHCIKTQQVESREFRNPKVLDLENKR